MSHDGAADVGVADDVAVVVPVLGPGNAPGFDPQVNQELLHHGAHRPRVLVTGP